MEGQAQATEGVSTMLESQPAWATGESSAPASGWSWSASRADEMSAAEKAEEVIGAYAAEHGGKATFSIGPAKVHKGLHVRRITFRSKSGARQKMCPYSCHAKYTLSWASAEEASSDDAHLALALKVFASHRVKKRKRGSSAAAAADPAAAPPPKQPRRSADGSFDLRGCNGGNSTATVNETRDEEGSPAARKARSEKRARRVRTFGEDYEKYGDRVDALPKKEQRAIRKGMRHAEGALLRVLVEQAERSVREQMKHAAMRDSAEKKRVALEMALGSWNFASIFEPRTDTKTGKDEAIVNREPSREVDATAVADAPPVITSEYNVKVRLC